jgi:hypothetical protein
LRSYAAALHNIEAQVDELKTKLTGGHDKCLSNAIVAFLSFQRQFHKIGALATADIDDYLSTQLQREQLEQKRAQAKQQQEAIVAAQTLQQKQKNRRKKPATEYDIWLQDNDMEQEPAVEEIGVVKTVSEQQVHENTNAALAQAQQLLAQVVEETKTPQQQKTIAQVENEVVATTAEEEVANDNNTAAAKTPEAAISEDEEILEAATATATTTATAENEEEEAAEAEEEADVNEPLSDVDWMILDIELSAWEGSEGEDQKVISKSLAVLLSTVHMVLWDAVKLEWTVTSQVDLQSEERQREAYAQVKILLEKHQSVRYARLEERILSALNAAYLSAFPPEL